MSDQPADNTPPAFPPVPYTWEKRRKYLYQITIFCMGVIVYILWKGMQGSVAEAAITMAFLCIGSMAGSYVFGAAWQDINHMQTFGQSYSAYSTNRTMGWNLKDAPAPAGAPSQVKRGE